MDVASTNKVERSLALARRSHPGLSISHRSIEPATLVTDAVVLIAACAIWQTCYGDQEGVNRWFALIGLAPLVCALFIPAAKLRGLYRPSSFLSGELRAWDVAVIWLSVAILLGLASLTLNKFPSMEAGAAFILTGLVGLLGHRLFWNLFLERATAADGIKGRKVLLISRSGSASAGEIFDSKLPAFDVEHHLTLDFSDTEVVRLGRYIDQVARSAGSEIEDVVIAAQVEDWQRLKPYLVCLSRLPVAVSLVPCGSLAELLRRPVQTFGQSVVFELQPARLSGLEGVMKRSLDFVGALFCLLMLLPSLALVAVLIKLDSRGPVLFWQTRLGRNGKPFRIWKFRTMTVLEDGAAVRQATPGDQRVTRLGRWLRITSIDELPQLINVLKGDMSLVGPRPHAVLHDDQFGQLIADYALRRRVKPGITGLAQVMGFRGATPTVDLMETRVRLDNQYIENWSIWLDIGILARTLTEVVGGRNAC
jgi:Undecaprenyl-phosphate glucose phosphotransferase